MTTRLEVRDIKAPYQGAWTRIVTYSDGSTELVPTAHTDRKDWYDAKTHFYFRADDSVMAGSPTKREQWRDAFQSGKVVMTQASWEDDNTPVGIKNIAVCDIAELEPGRKFDDRADAPIGDWHSFRIVRRYKDCH